jgi:phenylalanyl-tRNA synthetase alpha subunit
MANELETRVAVLEHDVSQMSSFFSKLDLTMEKMTDISSSIKEMLAVHDMKIIKSEEHTENLYSLIEKRRYQSETQHQVIQNKISETEKEIKRDMDDFQKSVISEMKDMRKELKEYYQATQKNTGILDKGKLVLTAIGILLTFILYKLGVIPFVKF